MSEPPEVYRVTDWSVYDGDSINCTIQMEQRVISQVEKETSILGIAVWLEEVETMLRGTAEIKARVGRVDAPEIRKKRQRPAGLVAKQFTQHWFELAGEVELVFECRGKYKGRYIVDFRPIRGGISLATYLLRSKTVHAYDGGTKLKWTDKELKRIAGMKP